MSLTVINLPTTNLNVANAVTQRIVIKSEGPQGPPGPAGPTTGDLYYLHTQTVPASTWTITHLLNKLPAISVIDSAGDEVIGDVHYDDTNHVTLTFGGAFSGTASCN